MFCNDKIFLFIKIPKHSQLKKKPKQQKNPLYAPFMEH